MARQDVENVEMIEIASPEEVMENEDNLPIDLALLSLRNTVLFPGIVIPVTVTRQKFIKMVKKSLPLRPYRWCHSTITQHTK